MMRASLPEFKQRLAALPENQSGLKEAETRLRNSQRWGGFDEETRAAYVAAAKKRRDEIAKAIEAAFAKRRAAALAAGGDPDLVGYTFADKTTGIVLEFSDERQAYITILGIKMPAPYKVDGDTVIVEGPNGRLVLDQREEFLVGMGMNMQRLK